MTDRLKEAKQNIEDYAKQRDTLTASVTDRCAASSEKLAALTQTLAELSKGVEDLTARRRSTEDRVAQLYETLQSLVVANRTAKGLVVYREPNEKQKEALVKTADNLASQTSQAMTRIFTVALERYKQDAAACLEKAETDVALALRDNLPNFKGELDDLCKGIVSAVHEEATKRLSEQVELVNASLGATAELAAEYTANDIHTCLRPLLLPELETNIFPSIADEFYNALGTTIAQHLAAVGDEQLSKQTDMTGIVLRDIQSRVAIIEGELLKAIDVILQSVGALKMKLYSHPLNGLMQETKQTDFVKAIGVRAEAALATVK